MCESHTNLVLQKVQSLVIMEIWPTEGPDLHDHRAGSCPDRAEAGDSGLVARAAALTQRGAQQGFGGIGGRARGDRAGVGAVELTQLDAVKGNPGIMDREFQLPCCLIDLHLTRACPGNAHWPPSLPGARARADVRDPGSPHDRCLACPSPG